MDCPPVPPEDWSNWGSAVTVVATLITVWFLVKKERREVAAVREADEKQKLTELSQVLEKTEENLAKRERNFAAQQKTAARATGPHPMGPKGAGSPRGAPLWGGGRGRGEWMMVKKCRMRQFTDGPITNCLIFFLECGETLSVEVKGPRCLMVEL